MNKVAVMPIYAFVNMCHAMLDCVDQLRDSGFDDEDILISLEVKGENRIDFDVYSNKSQAS